MPSFATAAAIKAVPGLIRPNLEDYPTAEAEFSWAAARRELVGLPNQAGLNIAHEAVDRHASGPRAGAVVLPRSTTPTASPSTRS